MNNSTSDSSFLKDGIKVRSLWSDAFLIPVVTYMDIQVGQLLGGPVIVESVLPVVALVL